MNEIFNHWLLSRSTAWNCVFDNYIEYFCCDWQPLSGCDREKFCTWSSRNKKYIWHISTPTWQSPILELPQHPVTRTHKWKQFPANVSWAKNMIENIDFHAHTSSISEEIANCEHHTPTSDEIKFMAANWNRDNVCDILLGMRRKKERGWEGVQVLLKVFWKFQFLTIFAL